MCLSFVHKLDNEHGYAYKVVKTTTTPGIYKGKWSYFNKGAGGTLTPAGAAKANRVRWKVGRQYRVKHNHKTRAYNAGSTEYLAGVHLWYNFSHACSNIHNYHGIEVVLVCKYTQGFARDRKTVVAKRVTPVLVLANWKIRPIEAAT